jgi:predicted unusual protein kinase regulating ubiquinone biosynthesis (AarF/ABC1/UbiB family)
MTLGQRLDRYRLFASFFSKYGSTDVAGDTAELEDGGSERALAFARDVESLGPTFIKLGQLLSTRADFLPPAYVTALERLQDDVAPFPGDQALAIVEDELGVKVSKAFRAFDTTPIAAASLGQVHRAVLRSGRHVAVKVQRPHVREQVLQDLDALDHVAALLSATARISRAVDVTALLEEFRRTLLAELDYLQEARNLTTIGEQLRDFPTLIVPQPIADYTSSRVLTMDAVEGTKITRVSRVEWTEVDGKGLAADLFRAYLQQILVDGTFHADPHPGNILLTRDRRLALVDLGMVGRLSQERQEQLLRLMLAIADGRSDEASIAVAALGERLEDFDGGRLERVVGDLVGRFKARGGSGGDIGAVILELARGGGAFGLRLSPEMAMLGKTLLHLGDVGRTLDPDFNVTDAMRGEAASMVRRRSLRAMAPSRLLATAADARELAERLPGRLNRVLDALAANDLRLKVELIDHGAIIDGLQKVANRIALGLVLASLILGAALLMRVQTTFTILGYPGLAMLLFLAAAAGGSYMIWTILSGDVRRAGGR